MFQWGECLGCEDMDRGTCEYDGKYWECPYAQGVQEEDDNN